MFDFGLEHPAVFTAFAGFLLVLTFYVLGWWLTGRDPAPAPDCDEQGTPPENLSPAALRYLNRMAPDAKSAAAALMSLAARGHLTVELDGDRTRLRKTDNQHMPASAGEAALAHGLLYTRSTLVLHNSVSKVIAPALRRFRHKLALEHGHEVFRENRGWLIAGLALSALVIAAAALQSRAPTAFAVLSVLAIAAMVGLAALVQALLPRRYIFPEPLSNGLRTLVRRAVEAGFIVFLSPLAIMAVAGWLVHPPVPMTAIALVAALAGLHVVVYHLMKAPTVPGAGLRSRIESFRAQLPNMEVRNRELPVPAGIYAFALDRPDETAWASPPSWLRLAEPGMDAPKNYGELGERLARALHAAAMPPADALFVDHSDPSGAVPSQAAQ